MKLLLMALLALSPTLLTAQASKPGKLRITPGLFATRYELGDNLRTRSEVNLHLKQHDQDAAHYFQRAKGHSTTAAWTSLLGSGALLVSVWAKRPATRLTSGCISVVAYSFTLGYVISGNQNQRRAQNHYNAKFGY